jgi:hypothetical protein
MVTVNRDTDGTAWVTVSYTYTVDVMADSEDEALMYADVLFNDQTGANPNNFYAEVL